MNSFAELVRQDRRLVILRLLAEDPDYAVNDRVLQTCLDHLGHGVALDVVQADLAWLKNRGLVTVGHVEVHILVATLTSRGLDVARGVSTVPGVKRPRPA